MKRSITKYFRYQIPPLTVVSRDVAIVQAPVLPAKPNLRPLLLFPLTQRRPGIYSIPFGSKCISAFRDWFSVIDERVTLLLQRKAERNRIGFHGRKPSEYVVISRSDSFGHDALPARTVKPRRGSLLHAAANIQRVGATSRSARRMSSPAFSVSHAIMHAPSVVALALLGHGPASQSPPFNGQIIKC